MMNAGILRAIELLGEANTEKTDKQTYVLICKIITAITEKKRQEWPSKDLRSLFNKMDSLQQKLFLAVLEDMKEAIEEAFGDIND